MQNFPNLTCSQEKLLSDHYGITLKIIYSSYLFKQCKIQYWYITELI